MRDSGGSLRRVGLRAVSTLALVCWAQTAVLAEQQQLSPDDVGVIGEAGLIKQAPPPPTPEAGTSALNDYPTQARADYVFGCMQVNGQSPVELAKCSCSIDVIASIIPYEKYVEAETILSVRQRGGESTAPLFAPGMTAIVDDLKRAQVEGEIKCF